MSDKTKRNTYLLICLVFNIVIILYLFVRNDYNTNVKIEGDSYEYIKNFTLKNVTANINQTNDAFNKKLYIKLLTKLYENSTTLFRDTLNTIGNFNIKFENIKFNSSLTTQQLKDTSAKDLNIVYRKIVNYIIDFQKIINEIEIVRNYFINKI